MYNCNDMEWPCTESLDEAESVGGPNNQEESGSFLRYCSHDRSHADHRQNVRHCRGVTAKFIKQKLEEQFFSDIRYETTRAV